MLGEVDILTMWVEKVEGFRFKVQGSGLRVQEPAAKVQD